MAEFGDMLDKVRDAGDRFTTFTDHLSRATSGITGFTESVRGMSRSTAVFGALVSRLPGAQPAGLAIAGLGVAGMAAGAVAGASMTFAASASPNGLSSVNKAFDILSGSIGQVVLPGFVALGGAALMAADRVQAWMDKNLDTAIDGWTQAILSATDAAKRFQSEVLDRFFGNRKDLPFGQHAPGPGGGALPFGPQFAIPGQPGAVGVNGMQFGPAGPLNQGPPGQQNADFAQGLRELAGNMRKITKDMQMSILPPSITDSASRWKEVALQIQQSELTMKQIEMQQRGIDASNKLADALDRWANRMNPQGQGGPIVNGRLQVHAIGFGL